MNEGLTRRAFSQGYVAVGVAVVAIPVLAAWKAASRSREPTLPKDESLVGRLRAALATIGLTRRP